MQNPEHGGMAHCDVRSGSDEFQVGRADRVNPGVNSIELGPQGFTMDPLGRSLTSILGPA